MPQFESPKYVYSSEHLLGILSQLREIGSPQWLDVSNELMCSEPQKSLLLTFDESTLKNYNHYNSNNTNNNHASKFKPTSNNTTNYNRYHTNVNSNINGGDEPIKHTYKKWSSLEYTEMPKFGSVNLDNDEEIEITSEKEKHATHYSLDDNIVADLPAEKQTPISNKYTRAEKLSTNPPIMNEDDNSSSSPSYAATNETTTSMLNKLSLTSSQPTIDDECTDGKTSMIATNTSLIRKKNDLSKVKKSYNNRPKSGDALSIAATHVMKNQSSSIMTTTETKKSYPTTRTSPNPSSNKKPYVKYDQTKDENNNTSSITTHGKSTTAMHDHRYNKGLSLMNTTKNSYSSSHGSTSIIMNNSYVSPSSSSSSSSHNHLHSHKKRYENSSYNHQNVSSCNAVVNATTTVNSSSNENIYKKITRQQPQHLTPNNISATSSSKQRVRPKSYNDKVKNVLHLKQNQSADFVPIVKQHSILTIEEIMQEQMAEKLAEEKLKKQQFRDEICKQKQKQASWLGGITPKSASEAISIEQIELEEKAKNIAALSNGKPSLRNISTDPNKDNQSANNPDGKFWDSAMKFF